MKSRPGHPDATACWLIQDGRQWVLVQGSGGPVGSPSSLSLCSGHGGESLRGKCGLWLHPEGCLKGGSGRRAREP